MSRTDTTELDIINAVSVKVGKGILTSTQASDDEDVREILLGYKLRYELLLATFPWSFASNRDELQRHNLPSTDNSGFAYRYSLPPDGLYLWEIYRHPQESLYNTNAYDNRRYNYTPYPILDIDASILSPNVGTLLNGYIYSSAPQLYALYTRRGRIEPQNFTAQFKRILENEIEVFYQTGKQKPTEALNSLRGENQRVNKEMRGSSSKENRYDNNKVSSSDTLAGMDSFY